MSTSPNLGIPSLNPLQASIPSADFQNAIKQGKVSDFGPYGSTQGPHLLSANLSQYEQVAQKLSAEVSKSGTAEQVAAFRKGKNQYLVKRAPWVFATFEDIVPTSYRAAAAGSDYAQTLQNIIPEGFNPQTQKSNSAIIWTTNPKSVSWQISQRGSEAKNKSGTVLHMYRDTLRKSDYDDPKLSFQFQTGSILPTNANQSFIDGFAVDKTPNEISGGLNDFYKFLQLVDQSKITQDGYANVIHILYRSRIFPTLALTGFFDPQMVVQFTDDSQNPNTVSSWSANFTVYSITPKLDSHAFNSLVNAFNQDDGDNGTGFTGM